MSIHDEEKSTEHKLAKVKLHLGREVSSGVQDSKENVLGMARNIRDTSAEKAHDATDYIRNQISDLKETGADTLAKIEKRIKSKPGQSVAIAFTAGLLASFLLGRRKS